MYAKCGDGFVRKADFSSLTKFNQIGPHYDWLEARLKRDRKQSTQADLLHNDFCNEFNFFLQAPRKFQFLNPTYTCVSSFEKLAKEVVQFKRDRSAITTTTLYEDWCNYN